MWYLYFEFNLNLFYIDIDYIEPAEDVEFLVQWFDLFVPGGNVQLERVPDVSSFLEIFDVAVDVRQRRGRRRQTALQLHQVVAVKVLQLL